MGSCLLGEAFAYSEAACSQEFRAQPRCSFAFVLLSSGSVVERELSPSRSCFHSYLSKISSTTFPKVSNCVPVSGRAGLSGGEGNCNHSLTLIVLLLLYMISYGSSVSVECPMKRVFCRFAADGNSGEMAFPLHEPVVCISTAQSKSPYLLAKPFGIFMLYNKYI